VKSLIPFIRAQPAIKSVVVAELWIRDSRNFILELFEAPHHLDGTEVSTFTGTIDLLPDQSVQVTLPGIVEIFPGGGLLSQVIELSILSFMTYHGYPKSPGTYYGRADLR